MIILDYFIIASIKIKIKNKHINNYRFTLCTPGTRSTLVDFGALNLPLINCCLKLSLNLDGAWSKGARLSHNLINQSASAFEMTGGSLLLKW